MNDAVEIAGAGPAGLSAAITLSKAGRKVIMYEANGDVGARFQQDFQGLENWTTDTDVLDDLLQLGIEPNFRHCGMRDGIAYDMDRHAYDINNPVPLFYLIERGPRAGSLDTALRDQALACGVTIRFNQRIKTLQTPGILATGPKAADAIAVGYHCKTDMPNGYWVICDDQIAPLGYAYLLIWDGWATIKTCMFSDFKNEQRYVERTVGAFNKLTGFTLHDEQAHGGAGNFLLPVSAYSGQHKMVGEHAGFQDTLWGFGMRIAIKSGVLAAQSILTGKDYNQLWQHHLGDQLKASIVNRAIYAKLGNRGYRRTLKIFSKHKNIRQGLQRYYHLSLMKRLLLPWAKSYMVSHRRDKSCNHDNCTCVWCRQRCGSS